MKTQAYGLPGFSEEHSSQLAVPVPREHQEFRWHDEVVQEVASARHHILTSVMSTPLQQVHEALNFDLASAHQRKKHILLCFFFIIIIIQ